MKRLPDKVMSLVVAIGGVLQKKVFSKISQNSQETPVLEPLFNKLAGLMTKNLLKRRILHRCFLVNLTKFLRTHFSTEHFRRVLL